MTYTVKLTRDAMCRLEGVIDIQADSQEEAARKAIMLSEESEAIAFTVTSIDLSSVSGSTEITEVV